jgi:hypothetical protein
MKKTLLRLTSSGLLATTSIFAVGLAKPSMPKVSQISCLNQAAILMYN